MNAVVIGFGALALGVPLAGSIAIVTFVTTVMLVMTAGTLLFGVLGAHPRGARHRGDDPHRRYPR